VFPVKGGKAGVIPGYLSADRERIFTEEEKKKTQTNDLGLTSNNHIEGAVYDRPYIVDSRRNGRS
jgi:hypothetical protein